MDAALIGATAEDEGGPFAGSVYVFVRKRMGWTRHSKLIASDARIGDAFGNDVVLSGDIAVVGAFSADVPGVGEDGGVIGRLRTSA